MGDKDLTDKYVAELMAKDARGSSIKYSALGMDGLGSSKPASKPKPNTRFLRNIIKDTDSHNAALLAKEAAESRARLEGLSSNEYRTQKASQVGGGDIRRRQLGDIAAILGGGPRKRRKVEDANNDDRKESERAVRARSNATGMEDQIKVKSRIQREGKDREGREDRGSKAHESHRRHRTRSVSRERTRDKESRGRERDERRNRDRSRSPREHRSKEIRHRSRSPRRKRSRSPEPEREREKSRWSHRMRRSPSTERRPKKKEEIRSTRKSERAPDYDSDPLDDIIGPRPPRVPEVRTRGRGTISDASGIDSRFSAHYDPTVDVQLHSDEENDWDQALEALRDRTKWKQQGADRLRAAGFTEDEITKWEKSGKEKQAEDVKWAKKGEGREWDRGKVIGDDGDVTFEAKLGNSSILDPDFGRLR